MSQTEHTSPTPYRETFLEFGYEENGGHYPAYSLTRRASDMVADPSGTANVANLPTGAIILSPRSWVEPPENQEVAAGTLRLEALNVAEDVVEIPMLAPPDAPADGYDATTYFLRREVGADQWGIVRDVPTVHPNLPFSQIHSKEQIHAKATSASAYPENTPVRITVVRHQEPVSNNTVLAVVSFGGRAANRTQSNGNAGGVFCLVLYPGYVQFFEYIYGYGDWVPLLSQELAPPPGNQQTLVYASFIPFRDPGSRCVGELVFNMRSSTSPSLGGVSPRPGTTPSGLTSVRIYRPLYLPDGSLYPDPITATGSGQIQVSMQDYARFPFQIAVERFKPVGTIQDAPFVINTGVPAGKKIRVAIHHSVPPSGGSITAKLYDASTGSALTEIEDGWATTGGKNAYYPIFTLSGDSGRTPAMMAYTVYTQGEGHHTSRTVFTGGELSHLDIFGPDLDPKHEQAEGVIEDLRTASGGSDTELALLRKRGRVYTRVKTRYDAGDPSKTCTLFEGETARVVATKMGTQDKVYPAEKWRSLQASFVGMWSRLEDQMSMARHDFNLDPDAPLDPQAGFRPPWRMVDVLRWLLEEGGVSPEEIDLPTDPGVSDLRFWIGGGDPTEALINPTDNILEWIRKAAVDFLGAYSIRDPNAGAHGMWRVKLPPIPPYTPIWNFVDEPVASTGKLVHDSRAYPARTSIVTEWSEYVKPPAANFVCVTAVGQTSPVQGKGSVFTQFMWNPKSFNFRPGMNTADPEHPDYLGRFVPLIYINPLLVSDVSKAGTEYSPVAFACRRLYDQVAHAQNWIEFRAPLPLVDDPGDTYLSGKVRPLRLYDVVTFTSEGETLTVVLRNCNIQIDNDRCQWLIAEGIVVERA